MKLIELFVDWLLGPKNKDVDNDEHLYTNVPSVKKKNIENIKLWLAETEDHQILFDYYSYAIGQKAKPEIIGMIKNRLIEVCDSISPTLKEQYLPDEYPSI